MRASENNLGELNSLPISGRYLGIFALYFLELEKKRGGGEPDIQVQTQL